MADSAPLSKLDRAKRDAQATANRTGAPCALLNFNRAGAALYCIRDIPPPEAVERNGAGWLVATFEPEA